MDQTSAKATDKLPGANTTESFRKFLEWLDQGKDSGGESYLRMRGLMVAYFDRRNCVDPEGLADDTLARVERRLAEEGEIETDAPAKFCYTWARFVLLEYFRSARTREVSLDTSPQPPNQHLRASDDSDENHRRERMLSCLDRCVQRLEPEQRELVLNYYFGEQRAKIDNRKRMAADLQISVNALSIRACRIRERLEGCVKGCADGK